MDEICKAASTLSFLKNLILETDALPEMNWNMQNFCFALAKKRKFPHLTEFDEVMGGGLVLISVLTETLQSL